MTGHNITSLQIQQFALQKNHCVRFHIFHAFTFGLQKFHSEAMTEK